MPKVVDALLICFISLAIFFDAASPKPIRARLKTPTIYLRNISMEILGRAFALERYEQQSRELEAKYISEHIYLHFLILNSLLIRSIVKELSCHSIP
jgi:hypothetical protein